MTEVIGLRENEEVLIVTNPEKDVLTISKALFEETKKLGGKPSLMVQGAKTTYDYAERVVLEAMRAEPDIIVSLSTYKMGKDPQGISLGYVGRDGQKYNHIFDKLLDGDRRCRSFWSPSNTLDTFLRCVPVDYGEMRKRAARLKSLIDGGKEIRVTSPAGTDVTISIKDRQAKLDDGDFRSPGTGGNLPSGEVYISPAIASARGTIVFDGTISLVPKSVIPKMPVTVKFHDGYVSEVSGGQEAKALMKVIENGEKMAREKGLREAERNARHLGELGIGLNNKAKMVGQLLEDEKVGRTVHFAIGTNYDNDAEAFIHQDCLVLHPSMWLDGKRIMRDGDLLLG